MFSLCLRYGFGLTHYHYYPLSRPRCATPPPGWLQAGLLYICWDGDTGICFEQVVLRRPVRDIEAGDWCAEGKLSSESPRYWGPGGRGSSSRVASSLAPVNKPVAPLASTTSHEGFLSRQTIDKKVLDQRPRMNCISAVIKRMSNWQEHN